MYYQAQFLHQPGSFWTFTICFVRILIKSTATQIIVQFTLTSYCLSHHLAQSWITFTWCSVLILVMNDTVLKNREYFIILEVTIDYNHSWHNHVAATATSAVKKRIYVQRQKIPLLLKSVQPICNVSQFRSNIEYCSDIWGASPSATRYLPHAVQKKQ